MLAKFVPQYEPLFDKSIGDDLKTLIDSGSYLTEYKKTQELESEISKFIGCKHTIMLPNGTISLSAALIAGGIEPGDQVVVPNITMIATYTAVKFIGAVPVLAEVNEQGLLDIDKLESTVNLNGIKAIIYVSLNGKLLKEEQIKLDKLCDKYDLLYIEDAAQSFGSMDIEDNKYNRYAFGCSYSFSMPKIISGGQGGCVCTDNDYFATVLRELKDFGREGGGCDYHPSFGINLKITDMQAVVLLKQLKSIDKRIDFKRSLYFHYEERLNNCGIGKVESIYENNTPWFITFVLNNTINKNHFMKYLKENNIGTRSMYPPINTQPSVGDTRSFVISKEYSDRRLWLPSSFTIEHDTVDDICTTIEGYKHD